MHRIPGLLLSALLLTPAALAGQQSAVCGRLLATPPVGTWARYDIGKDGSMTLAVVGKETRAGKALVWFEMAMQDAKGQGAIMKMLVPGYPYQMDGVEEMIMKAPGQPAMRMPQSMMAMMRSRMAKQNMGGDLLQKCAAMPQLDRAEITVPAGTFQTLHYVDPESGGQAWVVEDLPFHLIKAVDRDGKTAMVLVAHGTDATTAITETPAEIPGMN